MGPSTLFEKWDPKCLNCLLYKAARLPNNLFFFFSGRGKNPDHDTQKNWLCCKRKMMSHFSRKTMKNVKSKQNLQQILATRRISRSCFSSWGKISFNNILTATDT